MARKTPLAIQAEYYPLRALLFLLRILPFFWSRALCRGLLQTLMHVIRKRRQLMKSQLAACFPTLSSSELEALARRSLNTLADGVATFSRISSFNRKTLDHWVTIEGFEHIEEAFRKGRGMITFTAHMGCWELMAVYVTWLYPRVAMVVRPLDNPKLDAMVTRIRSSGGGAVIDSHRVLKEGIRLLRSNGILGVLIDQNFYKGGVFVDFFGRPAATNTLVPILAHRTGCVVLPMHNVWRNGKIHIICEAPVQLSENPDITQAIAEDTQTLTAYVERWVRETPEQWLWLHNRWKRRPLPGEIPAL